MNDKELADKVVALGIFTHLVMRDDLLAFHGTRAYSTSLLHHQEFISEAELLIDWRLAGALMEKTIKDDRIDLRCVSGSWMPSLERFDACVASSATPTYGVYLDRSSESLPRAIIEACVTALDKEK